MVAALWMGAGGRLGLLRLAFASRFCVLWWRLVGVSCLFRLGVCVVGASRFLSCVRLVMASRRGVVLMSFVFCLCVLLVVMIDGSC